MPVFAPGDAELDLLANVLGEGRSSRLYQRLVHDLKIAQSVSADHMQPHAWGHLRDRLQCHAGTFPGRDRDGVIDEELDKLRAQPPTPDEMERAQKPNQDRPA